MKKHMKKLISALLAGAMLISSLGVVSLAEETTTTPATTVAAETDAYANEAMGLLTTLKIFEGYEDGSYKLENNITRAEMTKVILVTLGTKAYAGYTGLFTDVPATHWAANMIQTAKDANIINGMGDGTFAPDANVTYEQAVKMVMCALNFGEYAQANGGYPTGYLTLAAQKDIEVTKNTAGVVGEPATRGTVAKLLYNGLNALYPTMTGFEGGMPKYTTEKGKTLASEKHKVYVKEGIITATNKVSIDNSQTVREGEIVFDGEVVKSSIKNADSLVANYVKAYYYDPSKTGDDKDVIYAFAVASKNDSITIAAKDIEEITNAIGDSECKIDYLSATGKTKTLKLGKNPTIVYNDQLLTVENWNRLAADNAGLTLEEFITPVVGDIKVVDYEKDGTYDIIFVQKYETAVVKAATQTRVTLENPILGSVTELDVDTTENDDMIVTVSRDGGEIRARNLTKGNILTIKMNANFTDKTFTGDKKITIEATTKTLVGKVKSKDVDDNDKVFVTIDGIAYEVDPYAVNDVTKTIGAEATFSLDKFGRIAYVKTEGKISSSEKYGWIINAYSDNDYENPMVKIYTQDGKEEIYEVANKVDFWAPKALQNKTLNMSNTADKDTILSMRFDNSGFFEAISATQMRLVKYKLNSDNKVSKLYCSTNKTTTKYDETTDTDTSAVEIDLTNYNGSNSVAGIFAGKYSLKGDLVQFVVPKNPDDITDTSLYAVGTIAASTLLVTGDSSVSYDFCFAEFDKMYPSMQIKFVAGADEPKNQTYNTADDRPVFMVSKVTESIDADDNTIYTIKGYQEGSEVVYNTLRTSTLNLMTSPSTTRDYTTTNLWDGKSTKPLTDFLKPGDVCGIVSSGVNAEILVKMVDINVITNVAIKAAATTGQYFGTGAFSGTRDRISIGAVESVQLNDTAVVTLTGAGLHSFGLDKAITTVEVTCSGSDVQSTKVLTTPTETFEISPFDAAKKEGDYMFVREFKGGMREVYVIRFIQK